MCLSPHPYFLAAPPPQWTSADRVLDSSRGGKTLPEQERH